MARFVPERTREGGRFRVFDRSLCSDGKGGVVYEPQRSASSPSCRKAREHNATLRSKNS